LIILLGAAPQ